MAPQITAFPFATSIKELPYFFFGHFANNHNWKEAEDVKDNYNFKTKGRKYANNCETRSDESSLTFGLYATRNINAGEEITWDYKSNAEMKKLPKDESEEKKDNKKKGTSPKKKGAKKNNMPFIDKLDVDPEEEV